MHNSTIIPTGIFPSIRKSFPLCAPVFGLAAFVFLVAACLPMSAQATATGNIEGSVYNQTNGLPLGRAKVSVKSPDRQEVLTDDEGRFQFANVPAGSITLEVSYLGFDSQTATVIVEAGKTATREFQLTREGAAKSGAKGEDVVMLEKFSVVADQAMTAQALAMNEQRHAANIKNIVAMEDLGDFGTENIGDYIRFMPGVAIIDDGEDAGRLALGGFPAEMTNVQLDGGDVASTGIGTSMGRTLALQEVPMVNVERVEVTKVPTPDMSAAGLGGSMNLVTKSLLGTRRAYLDYKMYMNFNNKEGVSFDGGGKQPTPQVSPKTKKPSFSVSVVVPAGKRLVFSAGASRSWRQRPSEGTPSETALWNFRTDDYRSTPAEPLPPKDIAFATGQWSQIAQLTVTENVQFGVEWKVARNDTLAFNVQSRQITIDRASSRLATRFHYGLYYDPVGDASQVSTKPGAQNVGGTLEMGGNAGFNYREIANNTHMTLRYKHRGAKWQIDGQAVYSHANRKRSSLDQGYFSGYYALGNEKAGTATGRGYDLAGYGINESASILPSRITVKNSVTGESIDPYDGNSYRLNSVRDEDGVYKTDMYSGRVDVARTFSQNFSLKAGGSFNRLEKDDWQVPTAYTFLGDPQYGNTSSATGLFETQKISHYDVLDDAVGVDMNGNPVRWISPVKLYKLFLSNPEFFAQNATAIQYRAERSKKMIEDISAAYLRFDLRLFSNRMHIVGGVRYEKTDLDGWSVKTDETAKYVKDPVTGLPLKNTDGTWKYVTPDTDAQMRLMYQERAFHEGKSYDGFFPSLNINYSFTENLVVRAAYARTIGRPDVKYVVDGIRVPDVPEEETESQNARVIRVGNPALEPWTADSFHLSLDSYHLKGGFGSIGVYRKNVTNFFAERDFRATKADLEYYSISESDINFMIANDYAVRRWVNVGDAQLTGFEMSYRQDLFFLPSWLQKMQVWLNYTHLKVGGENAADFTGFTPDALSWGVNYIRPRFSVRLTCAYQAETKKALVGTEGQAGRYIPEGTYDYQASIMRYGLTAEYSLSRAFTLYMTWDNIFGKDTYVYRRAPDSPSYAQKYQRLVIPTYIMIGVKGRF